MLKYRFLFSGSGGQGIITMAILLAEAAAIHEGLTAIQSQVYGPEARGGATRSDVIISDGEIYFPKVTQPGILISLNQSSFAKYSGLIRPGALVLVDSGLVNASKNLDARVVALPFHETVLAEFGKTQALNICALGALVALTQVIRIESMQKTLAGRFPKMAEINFKALNLGIELAETKKDLL